MGGERLMARVCAYRPRLYSLIPRHSHLRHRQSFGGLAWAPIRSAEQAGDEARVLPGMVAFNRALRRNVEPPTRCVAESRS
jgi:hypothetical protein